MGFFEKLFSTPEEDEMNHSHRWFEETSFEVINNEREKVRLRMCAGDAKACDVLDRYDREIALKQKKLYGDEEPGYPVHREHGWHLPSDD